MDNNNSVTVELYFELITDTYCVLGSSAFVIYDQLITFDREVRMFWRSKATWAAALFFANRYIILMSTIITLVGQSGALSSDQSCGRLMVAEVIVQCLPPLVSAVFSTMRAFALTNNRLLSLLVFLLSMVAFGTNMSRLGFHLTGSRDTIVGCLSTDSTPPSLQIKFVIITRSCVIGANAILILITWVSLHSKGTSIGLGKGSSSLSNVLLSDGLMYFIVLLMVDVLHLLFSVLSIFANGTSSLSFISVFTNPFTAVLVSRFLLDLQEANRRSLKLNSDDPLHLSLTSADNASLGFARATGSLASSIPPRMDDEWRTDIASDVDVDVGTLVVSQQSTEELEKKRDQPAFMATA